MLGWSDRIITSHSHYTYTLLPTPSAPSIREVMRIVCEREREREREREKERKREREKERKKERIHQ
jgi:hypothetical protein